MSYTPYRTAFGTSGSGQSWTSTRVGWPLGSQPIPGFFRFPTTFFFASMLITSWPASGCDPRCRFGHRGNAAAGEKPGGGTGNETVLALIEVWQHGLEENPQTTERYERKSEADDRSANESP